MPASITIAANAVVAKLISGDERARNILTDKLSYLVEGYEFMNAFTSGSWNGRSSFFSRKDNTFPAGFAHLAFTVLTSAGYCVRVVKREAVAPLGPENPIVDEFGNDDPRYDFQLRAVDQVEKYQRGIIQVATGGGKSKIAKLIMARYRRMTLFLTTRGVLLYQMRDQVVKDCKFNVGIIGDGEWSPTRGVNCGMVQTLVSQLEEPKLDAEVRDVVKRNTNKGVEASRAEIVAEAQARFNQKTKVRNRAIKLLELVEVVIGEEAHEAGGNFYYEILRWCKNAHIRIALTATPFMREDAEDNMRLMAAFGPVILKVSEALLIKRGILAKPYFLYRSPAPHKTLRRTSPYQRAVKFGIVEANFRNDCIVAYTKKAKEHGLTSLILVQRQEHGGILRELMTSAGIRTVFLFGEHNQRQRKLALTALAKGEIDALIGSTILDVGVDVPAIGFVANAGGGKAEVALRQRIGRGLRAKKSGPNVAFFLDFNDELNTHLRKHALERRAIVKATPGFAENVLADTTDFPWELFEKRKAA